MSTSQKTRVELTMALERAMRESSAKGVIYSQTVAERLGINSTDLECLDLIAMRGPLAAGEIANAAGLSSGAITGVLDRLERAGFARRERDASDRRKVLVRLVSTTLQRVAPLFEPMQRAAAAALAGYRDPELLLLLDFFDRVSATATTALAELRSQTKAPVRPARKGAVEASRKPRRAS